MIPVDNWGTVLCMACRKRPWRDHHHWPTARGQALRRAGYRCEICGEPTVEVHHDPPVAARGGYADGCQHHQDVLTVLCHEHHVEADQARRSAARGKPRQLSLLAA